MENAGVFRQSDADPLWGPHFILAVSRWANADVGKNILK